MIPQKTEMYYFKTIEGLLKKYCTSIHQVNITT